MDASIVIVAAVGLLIGAIAGHPAVMLLPAALGGLLVWAAASIPVGEEGRDGDLSGLVVAGAVIYAVIAVVATAFGVVLGWVVRRASDAEF